ncbi:MAG: ExbD/TolR family protein [Paracoccaceae bacterium]
MSMDFRAPARKQAPESIVPMINVVFLLLIFFLMTSRIIAPDPLEITLPEARQNNPIAPAPPLLLSATGIIAFEEARGAAAIQAFAAAQKTSAPNPQLRADKATAAQDVARLLNALAQAGLSEIDLIVEGQ